MMNMWKELIDMVTKQSLNDTTTKAKEQKFTIDGKLTGLNEFIRANRGNRYQGNECKQSNQWYVQLAIKNAKLPKVKNYPIKLKITWYEPNLRRDIDNITFATKFILDALVKEKIIADDSQKYVASISHDVGLDRKNPRIEIEIKESEE